MKKTIFSRLLLSHIAVILVITLTFGLLMSYLIRGLVVDQKRHELLTRGTTMVNIISRRDFNPLQLNSLLAVAGDLIGANACLADQNGVILAGNPPPRPVKRLLSKPTEWDDLFDGTAESYTRIMRRRPDPFIIVALPVTISGAPAAVFLYAPIRGVSQTISALERLLIFSLSAGIFAAIVLGFFMSRSLTRPIENISDTANAFAKGEFHHRTSAVSDDEIGNLGKVFNSMAESLANIEQNRRDFLANISHELKTPIANIQALTETILDGLATHPDQQRRFLSTIVNETRHIGRLIADLLDLSQLDAGELSIVAGTVNLNAFLAEQFTKNTYLFTEKELRTQLNIPADLPPVRADADRLAQIFNNLLSNAVRHAPASSTISVTAKKQSPAYISVAVTDQGPGIPLPEQQYIWDRFYRIEKSRSRSSGGTGLGLAITKKVVVAMGGEITVASEPGKGATFTFSLPVAK